jgi:hypothetical protein
MFINGDDVYVVPKVLMKVRRHDNCIGVINAETRVRTINENICIWDDMWEKMSDDFFVKAFYNDLHDKQVSDKTEIQCERMLVFLKLAEEKMQHRTTAINYFTRHYDDEGVKEILDEKYEFAIENFYELTGNWGWGKMESIYNDYIEDSKCMQEKSGVLKALLKYNHKLINMMDCDMPDVATDKIIFALNDYVDATAETMTVLNTEHTFKYDEWKQLIWSISNGESRKTPDWLEIKKALYAEADRVLEML